MPFETYFGGVLMPWGDNCPGDRDFEKMYFVGLLLFKEAMECGSCKEGSVGWS